MGLMVLLLVELWELIFNEKREKPGLTMFTDRFCFAMKLSIKNSATGMPIPNTPISFSLFV